MDIPRSISLRPRSLAFHRAYLPDPLLGSNNSKPLLWMLLPLMDARSLAISAAPRNTVSVIVLSCRTFVLTLLPSLHSSGSFSPPLPPSIN